ncbi:hypothetical protein GCM10010387_22700 [Streptomyces inusitatus]|uniref:Uncharacterized protein n=1 Tax=Streptomyces inusitatus TaxID=68221 RepID=A0A918UR67_9ACTN|nr:hypothetical protein GCM10010387_22700 [Streptomyces inusitatus]
MAKNVEPPTSQRPKVIPWEPAKLGAFVVVRQQTVQVSRLKKRDIPPVACPYCEGGHIDLTLSRPKTASGENRIIDLDELTVSALLKAQTAAAGRAPQVEVGVPGPRARVRP